MRKLMPELEKRFPSLDRSQINDVLDRLHVEAVSAAQEWLEDNSGTLESDVLALDVAERFCIARRDALALVLARKREMANAKREREEAPGWLREMGVPESLIAICMEKFPEFCGFQIYALLFRLRVETIRASEPISRLSEDELEERLRQKLGTVSQVDLDRILEPDYLGCAEIVGSEMQSA